MKCYAVYQLLVLLGQWRDILDDFVGSSVRSENRTTECFSSDIDSHLRHDCVFHEFGKNGVLCLVTLPMELW